MKDAGKYDLVVKELFQRDHPSLLDHLTAGVAVRQVLSRGASSGPWFCQKEAAEWISTPLFAL